MTTLAFHTDSNNLVTLVFLSNDGPVPIVHTEQGSLLGAAAAKAMESSGWYWTGFQWTLFCN